MSAAECVDIYPDRPVVGGAPLCPKGCGIPVWRHGLPTCSYCGIEINETPTRRDTRHDHCGPLPHTGAPRGPYCERCR